MEDAVHIPAMADEVSQLLAFAGSGWIVDATVGLGGHAVSLLEASPRAKFLGIDRDAQSLDQARRRLERFGDRVVLEHANFSGTPAVMEKYGIPAAKSILLDLGMSSRQLFDPARGFSLKLPGPLDMRMDTSTGKTLGEILSVISEYELTRAIRLYGQERAARRIARRILKSFKSGRIQDTVDLAREISAACGPRRKSEITHPATRTFQALRIVVNRELEALEEFIESARELLEVGGRIAVITFHSIEDRLVKRWLAEQAASCRCPPELPVCRCGGLPLMRLLARGKKPTTAEVEANPRSRSAKLRAAQRLR